MLGGASRAVNPPSLASSAAAGCSFSFAAGASGSDAVRSIWSALQSGFRALGVASCAQLVAGTQDPGEFVTKLRMVVQHELGSDVAAEVATLASYSTIVRNVDLFCGWCTLLVAHFEASCH